MKTEVIVMLFGFIAATIAYSMDWNKDQDKRISDLDKVLVKQQALNDLQTEYNELILQKEQYKKLKDKNNMEEANE